MRKLILGIIALVCLDIGFIYYTSQGLQSDLAVKETQAPDQAVTATGPANLSDDPGATSDTSAAENSTDTANIAALKAKPPDSSTVRRVAGVKVHSRMNERVFASRNRPLFTPVVFYVPRQSMIRSERTVLIKNTHDSKPAAKKQFVSHTPKPENRSLVARVWPVIKRPYEWIKVLGSKFN